jgi:isovaleryl-CoA dehydrogenase
MVLMKQILDVFDGDGVLAAMRDEVRRFSRDVVLPLDKEFSERGEFPAMLWRMLGDQGLLGITAPEEFGGLALGYLAHAVVAEEISAASGSIGLSYIAHSNLCVNQVVLNGTEAQRNRFLPSLIAGEALGSLAMSEPNSGSDVMSMRTTASRVNGGFVLNGTKLWITNGAKADVVLVYAKSNSEHNKLTAFLVTPDMSGFSVGQKLDKIGMRASETCELVFDNCFVPEEGVVGEVDRGVAVLMSGLNYERLILAAGALGLARAALEEATGYVRDRKQFGQPIGAFQAPAFTLAQGASDIDCVRSYVHATAFDLDRGGPEMKRSHGVRERCASVFLQAGQVAERLTGQAVKLMGGNGYTTDYRAGRLWADAMLYQIGGGTENIRLHLLARSLEIGY